MKLAATAMMVNADKAYHAHRYFNIAAAAFMVGIVPRCPSAQASGRTRTRRRRHRPAFSERNWRSLNPSGFNYGSGGLDAIRRGEGTGPITVEMLQSGFAREYAKSDLEEDVSCTADTMLTHADAIAAIAGGDMTQLLVKMLLVAEFYRTIDPAFRWKLDYMFHVIPPPDHQPVAPAPSAGNLGERIPFTAGPRYGFVLEQSSGGFRVSSVEPDSLAARAGLEAGDQVVSINDASVQSLSAEVMIRTTSPNQIRLVIRRDGRQVHIDMAR